MKITLFTSNHPRHISLIEKLSAICDELYVVQESATLFPGVYSDIYSASELHEEYFKGMHAAEDKIFGKPRFLSLNNTFVFSAKSGDASLLEYGQLKPALQSDYYIVFGASYIKGWLIDFLVERRAVNIHMGVSPYFRGAACNFWALYKGRADLVGATIHLLSKGLDSGDIIFHTLPEIKKYQAFDVGMAAVRAAHEGLCQHIKEGTLFDMEPAAQNRNDEIFYSRKSDFDEQAIKDFIHNTPTDNEILMQLKMQDKEKLLRPYYG